TAVAATRGCTISTVTTTSRRHATNTGARPRSPQQDQDPVTRAHSGNPGYLPGRLQRPSIGQAHNAKAPRRQRARIQVSPIRGRHDSDMRSIGRTARISGLLPDVRLWAEGRTGGEAGPTLARRRASSMSSGPGAAGPAPRLPG